MSQPDPSSAGFFEAKYRAAEGNDPWRFATAAYELGRYEAIITALADRRYARCFEPGCSVGVLTERLAGLCDCVDACDFSATAVARAKQRCDHLPQVRVQEAPLTKAVAWEIFDLIVLCEIGYYFDAQSWAELVDAMARGMQPGATLLASHWLGTSVDHVQTGAAVHMALDHPLLERTRSERHEGYLLERWRRRDASLP